MNIVRCQATECLESCLNKCHVLVVVLLPRHIYQPVCPYLQVLDASRVNCLNFMQVGCCDSSLFTCWVPNISTQCLLVPIVFALYTHLAIPMLLLMIVDTGRSTEINKVLVTSSCSTDETVVADSDVEMETATSIPASGPVSKIETSEDECLRKITVHEAECAKYDCIAENVVHIEESTKHDNEENAAAFKTIAHEFLPPNRDTLKPDSPYQTAGKSDGINITSSRDRNEGNMTRKDKGHASESENLDIIYSQDLIVREPNLPQSDRSSLNGEAINFKRFRKTSAPSGNSFNNLIPFSKYPYEESDYGNEDVAESVKEEKKRKQMEAIADDLFNNEKGRKRGASGSLRELFARG
ncbi:Nijmegen breakage syndrome 1 protein [Sesamum angolense]|uniref:Nijmegen breakage syndrome 1 protein n=1 Tax=Sesamum angolense TaxID=2727404 RepID=A0AAE2C557_9LAMI|nr:Nijmegen breakage syndrome 1 protein [Sesamum angolense]